MPSPCATVTPLARSTTATEPRTSHRMPSSVQKKAAKLGSDSIGKLASRPARSDIEDEPTTSCHSALIMPERSGGGGSRSTSEVGPDSSTQSPGVYVARHWPSTVLTRSLSLSENGWGP